MNKAILSKIEENLLNNKTQKIKIYNLNKNRNTNQKVR